MGNAMHRQRTLYTENEDISVAARMLTAMAFCSRKVKSVNLRINRIVNDYENRPILEYLRGNAMNLKY